MLLVISFKGCCIWCRFNAAAATRAAGPLAPLDVDSKEQRARQGTGEDQAHVAAPSCHP
jgi:hypothetical protein